MLSGHLSPEEFLTRYWQKKPLLLHQALPAFVDPISPEELAGLACEEEAEARLVWQRENTWELKTGPFAENDFTSLPEQGWTLLVQAVDHWFPAVKKLLAEVAFIPRWRINDIMVSYATKNAGVGPHFDYYDVFIIQGQGSRRWKIGQHCDSGSELDSKHSGLKILKHFETNAEWELYPGDVLYIPPGVAHYGISRDDSLSYSIGFRAPSLSEILSHYTDELCLTLTEDQRFSDPDLIPVQNDGEISAAAIGKLSALLRPLLADEQALALWFGRYMSEPKVPQLLEAPEFELDGQSLQQALEQGMRLEKNPASRFAWQNVAQELYCFADGRSFSLPHASEPLKTLLMQLNAWNDTLELEDLSTEPDCLNLLAELYNQGSLIETETT
ncbi:MAG: cupin domain-containing protein [Pseudomonadales bacterium]|nr:cupin domain-containing protein [Pseudomonadales bacterium]